MKHQPLTIALAVCLLWACGKKEKTAGNENTGQQVQVTSITAADLYDFDKVTAFAANTDIESREKAKQIFLKGVDEYRNKKNPKKGNALFAESILVFPDNKSYYELGNSFMDMKEYDNALTAYTMAEKMDYQPNSKVLYNKACAYSLLGNVDDGLKYMSLAIENGYYNVQHILEDEDLAHVRKDERFMKTYQTAMEGTVNSKTAMFDFYVMQFAKTSLPYTLNESQSQSYSKFTAIPYDFEKFVPQLRDAKFSRDVGSEYYYVACLKKTDAYALVIYAGVAMWSDDAPVLHYLTSYDQKGAIIDQLQVAGLEYPSENIRTVNITENLQVEVKEYSRTFEKDPDEHGLKDNKVLKTELVETSTYKVDDKGRIRDSKPLMGWFR